MDEQLRDPRTGLILIASPTVTVEQGRQLRRATRAGEAIRLHRGAYAERRAFEQLDQTAQHLTLIRAIVATRRIRPIISHLSAAVFWGMPLRPAMPTSVHVVAPPRSHIKSKNGVTVHHEVLGDGDVVEVDGLLVTSPLRTLLDLCRVSPFITAVTALDFALHDRRPRLFAPLSKPTVLEHAHCFGAVRGRSRALRAIEFSRAGADNAGETHSRIVMAELGFPPPQLQVRHVNPRGGYYVVDFEWPEYRVIGEFDGRGKYLKPEYLGRMTTAEAVFEEKTRENHLRAERYDVARWEPRDVNVRSELRRILVQAGLPCSH